LSVIGEDGLRSVETKHPCFLTLKHEPITWLFIYKDNKYKVVEELSIL
jgi:hypothetical protein